MNKKSKISGLFLFSLVVGLSAAPSFAAPPTGHPSVADAAKLLYIPQGEQQLPFHGRVLESFASNSYSYVRVLEGGKERWFAAPLVDLQPGMKVGYGQGTVMTNFYSRKWKRTFPEITFLNQITPLPE